jgi:UDP-3-O-[3-hydroxymyristoyl] N-acetylglucosamine deacetylase
MTASPPSAAAAPRPQHTIASPFALEGVGLHTGRTVRAMLRPAEAGRGIVFQRTDRAGPPLTACLDQVTATVSCVTLGGDGGVRTVEHLLSAARALGIDNLLVELDGPEVPGMDGSALPFVRGLRAAGIRAQRAGRPALRVQAPVWVGDGRGGWIVALPAGHLTLTCVVTLPAPAGGDQAATFDAAGEEDYEETIAPARTWGYERDAAPLRARGLALGASLDNTLAIGDRGYLNPPRFANEPARHKVLDLLGDLALLRADLAAAVIAVRAGHALHVALARALAAQAAQPAASS